MTMNATSTPSGSATIATKALRRWNRNTMQISATIANCSSSVFSTVAIDRPMRSERS